MNSIFLAQKIFLVMLLYLMKLNVHGIEIKILKKNV